MKILRQYIFKEALSYFLICLVAFTSILLTVRILKFTNLIVNKGVEFKQIALVFAAIIPTFLEIAVPMATLLGLMLAFARLSGDSEIVVLRSSGISLYQLLTPVLMFSVCTTVFALYVSLALRPWGYQTLRDTLFDIAQSKTTAGLDSGIFNELGKLTLYMESIDHTTGELTRTLIDDTRNEEERRIILAKKGRIVSNTDTNSIVFELRDGAIHEETDSGYSVTAFDSNFITLHSDDLLASDDKKRRKRLREEPTNRLFEYSRQLALFFSDESVATKDLQTPAPEVLEEVERRKWRQQYNQVRIELARRFAIPLASLLLGIIAMPLGIQPPRMQKTWGASLSLFLGLLLFAFYFGLMSVGSALGESGALHPYLGAWLPNVCLAALAFVFVRKMSSEQWQSIAHGVETFFLFVKNFRFRRQPA